MRGTQDALARLCDPDAEVSAHYVITPSGTLYRLVPEDQRAWHAGAGEWAGERDINSRSLGVELVNSGEQPFSEPQMKVLEALLADMMRRWNIKPHQIIAHSDMAPERKEDPGPRFDWRRLARQKLAFWPEGEGEDADLSQSLDLIGYPPALPEKRLQAFRFRFLPTAFGAETARDRRRASHIADAVQRLRKNQ